MAKRIEELDANFQDRGSRNEVGLVWISARDKAFTVNGLPWFEENGREFLRLPKRAKGVVRDPVWDLSTLTSGGRVRFKTDSPTLKLRIQHGRSEIAMPHMCAVGVSGIDLYEGPPEKMVYWASNKNITAGKAYVSAYFEGLPKQMREFTLYLPVYNDLILLEIGIDAGSQILAPSPFRLKKPVVFYGTSITQGGCSARGATGYVPLVGRWLGIDVINLGFSGNGQSDLEVADLITEIDAACFVNDCATNCSLEQMKTKYAEFNRRIRDRHPGIPILLMTSIRWTELWNRHPLWDQINAVAIQTYEDFRKRGDKNVHLLECRDVIGIEADHPSVDGQHMTDVGFKRLADAVAPVLRKLLGLA